jgi:hypothetical protein
VTRAKISQYSATANDNTDVNGVNIAEGCPPSSMNNMGREIMAALKRFQVGSDGDGVTVGGALVVSGATTANTFSATAVNATGTVTFSGSVILSGTTTANTFSTDLITEKTSAAGVTIDGVLLKDNGVVTGAGTVSAPVYSTTGDLNTGIFFPAADTIAFAEGGAEAMRIDASGRLLIGGTSAVVGSANGSVDISNTSENQLSLARFANGTGSPAIYFSKSRGASVATNTIVQSNDGLGTIYFRGANGTGYSEAAYILASVDGTPGASADMPGRLVFATSADGSSTPTERMRITSAGHILVGTTSSIAGGGGSHISVESGAEASLRLRRSTDGGVAVFYRSSDSNVGSISVTASATAYNTSSDYRLKENIASMTGALATVAQLKPCTYTWKADGSAGEGFIAHELAEVCPDAVTGEKDATEIRQVEVSPAVYEDVVIPAVLDEDGNEVEPERIEKRLVSEAVMEDREFPVYQGVDTSFLVATLTAAIQELSAKNDALEARLAALEQA